MGSYSIRTEVHLIIVNTSLYYRCDTRNGK